MENDGKGKSKKNNLLGRKILFSEFDFEGIGMSGEVPGVVWKVWEAGIIQFVGVNLNFCSQY